MSIEPNLIRYIFDIEGEPIEFVIDTGFDTTEEPSPVEHLETYPDWIRLEKDQCACCPLKKEDSPYCPAALRMHSVLETFKGNTSFEKVELTVETARRTYKQKCDLQSGLNSMLGLQMATSGCPVVGQLRAMATFHVPFSSFGETLFRSVSAYLTKQYFIHKEGGQPDWDLAELKAFYETLEGLNEAFSRRVKGIGQSDAIANAIVMFFASSIVVASAIEEGLEEYKGYFTGECTEPPMGG